MSPALSAGARTLPPPPEHYGGVPHRFVLRAGTPLWRVHDESYDANAFNSEPVTQDLESQFEGGRFDSTIEDPYPFLYAAGDDSTSVAERLLRDLPFDDTGRRELAESAIAGLCVSRISVESDLQLAGLRSGRDLAAIGIDTRLTVGPTTEYPVTRQWSAAIRGWDGSAQGLTWRSGREPDGFVFVFFGDRIRSSGITTTDDSVCGAEARDLISLIMQSYNVAVSDAT